MERSLQPDQPAIGSNESPEMTTIFALIDLDTSGVQQTLLDAGQQEGVDYRIVRAADELNHPSFVSRDGVTYLGSHAVHDYLASFS